MIHLFHYIRHSDEVIASLMAEENLRGEFYFLADDYSFFSWKKDAEGVLLARKKMFAQLRTFLSPLPASVPQQEMLSFEKDDVALKSIAQKLAENPNESVCFWFAQNASEVSMYLYALRYLESFKQQLYTVNIDNLPFFTSEKRIFFPHQMSQIQPDELVKCGQLIHQLSDSEIEMDVDMANSLVEIDAVRAWDSTKKLKSATFEQVIDEKIIQFLNDQKRTRKIERLLQYMEQYYTIDISPLVAWRLHLMIEHTVVQRGEALAKAWSEQDIILASKVKLPTTS